MGGLVRLALLALGEPSGMVACVGESEDPGGVRAPGLDPETGGVNADVGLRDSAEFGMYLAGRTIGGS